MAPPPAMKAVMVENGGYKAELHLITFGGQVVHSVTVNLKVSINLQPNPLVAVTVYV